MLLLGVLIEKYQLLAILGEYNGGLNRAPLTAYLAIEGETSSLKIKAIVIKVPAHIALVRVPSTLYALIHSLLEEESGFWLCYGLQEMDVIIQLGERLSLSELIIAEDLTILVLEYPLGGEAVELLRASRAVAQSFGLLDTD